MVTAFKNPMKKHRMARTKLGSQPTRRHGRNGRLPSRPWLVSPAPIDLLWSYRNRPPTELNIVKAARAALVWQAYRGRAAIMVAAGYLGWLRFPINLVRHLIRHGGSARRQHGRGLGGQVADMVRVAAINGVMPRDYYFGGLARYAGSDDILRYVPMSLYGSAVLELAREMDPAMIDLVKDKLAFERQCRDKGVPVVETVAIVDGEGILGGDGQAGLVTLPNIDLIIKPMRGRNGKGVELWRWDGSAYHGKDSTGVLSGHALLAHASARARSGSARLLIQKCLANNRELEPIAGSTLATTRFVTTYNEDSEPEIVEAFYRTSAVLGAAADNFHAGGLLFPIDLGTGQLRKGFSDRPWPPAGITQHPISGANMVGIAHPGWEAMRALALHLHGLFPSCLVVGWDIAFTPNGPVVIEANSCPEVSINRQGSFDGLVGTRLFGLLARHAVRWLETKQPANSRWRVSQQTRNLASTRNFTRV